LSFLSKHLKPFIFPLLANPKEIELYKQQMDLRQNAKKLTNSKAIHFINGMLPIIIDGTGKNFDKIKKQKLKLESIGYDVYLIFINTSLETALNRNQTRTRSLADEHVTKMWNEVQNNLGKFQTLFKNKFKIIDADKNFKGEEEKKLNLDLARLSMKILDSKLENPVGRNTIELLKVIKGKELNHIPDTIFHNTDKLI